MLFYAVYDYISLNVLLIFDEIVSIEEVVYIFYMSHASTNFWCIWNLLVISDDVSELYDIVKLC